MKNIYSKVKISSFLILIIFISFLSGLFRDVIALFLIIIIHEMGHIITSLLFRWKISKIDLTICGGFITYDEIIDKSFLEEFLIAISGFLMQGVLFVICFLLNKIGILDNSNLFLINKYNLSILLFNLLPIYPLDGSKILYIVLNIYIPYKRSLKLINIASFLNILILFLLFGIYKIKIEYSYIILLIFILNKIINYYKDIPYLFNKLLFERYYYPIKVNKYAYIKSNNINLFKRRKINYFKIGNHYLKERLILSKKFD